MAPTDKLQDVIRRSVGYGKLDVCVTCEGRMLKETDELKSCEVRDGSAVQIVSMARGGGGTHKAKRSEAGNSQAASPKRVEQVFRGATEERQRSSDTGVRQRGSYPAVGGKMRSRKVIEGISEGSDVEMGQAPRNC